MQHRNFALSCLAGSLFLIACGTDKPEARDGGDAGTGAAGVSGAAGTGTAGTVGTAGTGAAGTVGTAGTSGTAGTTGAAGTTMDAGTGDAAETSDGGDAAGDASIGCTASAACNDFNPCTDDSCNVSTGACQHVPNTNLCNDGNPCTTVDQCSAGQCVGSGAPNCDDSNVCTDDSCNPTSGACDHASNTRPCDDGDACTTVDQCSGGSCQGSGAPSCDDLNACTADSCDHTLGCIHPVVVCDDSSSCTNDSCEPAVGCKYEGNGSCTAVDAGTDATTPGCASNLECDDQNQCTTDVCNGGTCQHADTSAACNDGNTCTVDSCSPQNGCEHSAATDGTSCNDAFTCATGDVCNAGVCVGGNTSTQFAALAATGSGGGDPLLAIDDNAATSFSPTAANPRWIYVDLGSPKQIGRVVLDWDTTTYGGSYTIQVADEAGNDASTLATDAVWTSLYTQSLWDGATGHSDDITGLNAVGRYVRVYHWLPKTNFAVATTAVNLRELKVFGSGDAACSALPGSCADSTVPAGQLTYENDAAGNACAVVNGGAACGTTTGGGIGGTATIVSVRGTLRFANVDGGASGGAATLTFNAAGPTNARTAAAVYVRYEDGTEQGYGLITTAGTTFAATQSVQVWLKGGTHNTVEVRDTAGAANINGLPIVDALTVTRLAGPNKTCEGAPFIIDSFEGAPTNDWNLSVATGVTSGDRRAITKAGTVSSAFQGNATSATNPPTGDLCLRMDVTNFTWTTSLSNMSGLENAYIQLILGANAGAPTLTLSLTADGVTFNTPVVLTANNVNTNNGYGIIRNNMTNADTTTSRVLVPVAAFGVPPANLKQISQLRATISGNIWRIKDIQIVR